jgi:DegV family protein with EDD domain
MVDGAGVPARGIGIPVSSSPEAGAQAGVAVGEEAVMGEVRIVTDSCACIPEPLPGLHRIITVPYYVHIDGTAFRDMVDVRPGRFFEDLTRARTLPRTANPGPGDYLEAYRQAAAEGASAVVSVHMTSEGSGAYQSAMVAREMAREQLPNLAVEVVDTRNVAMCHGWVALEAARACESGADLSEVMELIRRLLPRVRMIQTADTLRYLYMGGRIGRAQHLVGSLLNIKPLISMEDGVIVALGQARSRQAAYAAMVEKMLAEVGPGGRVKVAYLHAAALDEVRRLRSMVERAIAPEETLIAELTPALGVHTGPGTVGICYLRL